MASQTSVIRRSTSTRSILAMPKVSSRWPSPTLPAFPSRPVTHSLDGGRRGAGRSGSPAHYSQQDPVPADVSGPGRDTPPVSAFTGAVPSLCLDDACGAAAQLGPCPDLSSLPASCFPSLPTLPHPLSYFPTTHHLNLQLSYNSMPSFTY